jgi:Alpha-2-macroglobulin family
MLGNIRYVSQNFRHKILYKIFSTEFSARGSTNFNNHRKQAFHHHQMPVSAMAFDSVPMMASALSGGGFAGGSGGAERQPIKVRKDFPETWIWEDIDDNQCDAVKFTRKVPDTITSWVISAFALNKENGLGLGDTSTLTVYKPFFVSTTLPYSVKRGEVLTLSIQIFNYLPKDQDVTVVMANEDQHFDFADDTDSREFFSNIFNRSCSAVFNFNFQRTKPAEKTL